MMKWFANFFFGCNGETVDQLENLKVPLDDMFLRRHGECVHVKRECKAIVDTIANPKQSCDWFCGV